MESEIYWRWFWLFPAYWRLRRRRHDRLFSSFPKRRSALRGSGNSCWRRGHHGARRHPVFPRNTIVAANRRCRVCDYWSVFAAQISLNSLCKNLESDISHGMCVADNVAPGRNQQIKMVAQFPSAAAVEREIWPATELGCWVTGYCGGT